MSRENELLEKIRRRQIAAAEEAAIAGGSLAAIHQARVAAGEAAVMDSLRERGLLAKPEPST